MSTTVVAEMETCLAEPGHTQSLSHLDDSQVTRTYTERLWRRLASIAAPPSKIVVLSSPAPQTTEAVSTVATTASNTVSASEQVTAATSVASHPKIFTVQKFYISPSTPIDQELQAVWNQQIYHRLNRILRDDIPSGVCLQEFMMVGRRADALKPTLVINCGHASIKRQVEKTFKSQKWLQDLLKFNKIVFVALVVKLSQSASQSMESHARRRSGLSPAAIAGIVIAIVIPLLIFMAAFVLFCRRYRRRRRRVSSSSFGPVELEAAPVGSAPMRELSGDNFKKYWDASVPTSSPVELEAGPVEGAPMRKLQGDKIKKPHKFDAGPDAGVQRRELPDEIKNLGKLDAGPVAGGPVKLLPDDRMQRSVDQGNSTPSLDRPTYQLEEYSVQVQRFGADTSCGLNVLACQEAGQGPKQCTLGGLLQVNGENMGLTAGHPFWDPRDDMWSHIPGMAADPDDEVDSEVSSEPFVFNEEDDTSSDRLSGISTPLHTDIDDSAVLSQIQPDNYHVSPVSFVDWYIKGDVILPSGVKGLDATVEEPLNRYDWALLVGIPEAVKSRPNKVAYLDPHLAYLDPHPDVAIIDVAPNDAEGKVIVSITGIGPRVGCLHASSAGMKVGRVVFDVQLIILERILRKSRLLPRKAEATTTDAVLMSSPRKFWGLGYSRE